MELVGTFIEERWKASLVPGMGRNRCVTNQLQSRHASIRLIANSEADRKRTAARNSERRKGVQRSEKVLTTQIVTSNDRFSPWLNRRSLATSTNVFAPSTSIVSSSVATSDQSKPSGPSVDAGRSACVLATAVIFATEIPLSRVGGCVSQFSKLVDIGASW